MAQYQWKGVDISGQIVGGVLQAKARHLVQQELMLRRVTPVSIKRDYRAFLTSEKFVLLQFTQQLLFLLQANTPLEKALQVLQQSTKAPLVQELLAQLRQKIAEGKGFASAMREFPQYFPHQYCVFIEVGESTSQLDETLRQLLVLMQTKKELQAQLTKALSYPIFLLVCTLLISAGIVFFVIPPYRNFFVEMGGELPRLTQWVLGFSVWLRHNGWLIAALVAAIIGTCFITSKQAVFRYQFDRAVMLLPWFNQLLLMINLVNWTYLLSLALMTGVPILQALTLANASLTNRYLMQQFQSFPTAVSEGKLLSDVLERTGLFSPAVLQLVCVGESSGNMATLLAKIAENYHAILAARLNKLAKCIEPIAMLILAVLVGLIIAALYLPMINLGLNVT